MGERRTTVPSTRSLAIRRCGLCGIVNVACVCGCVCMFVSTFRQYTLRDPQPIYAVYKGQKPWRCKIRDHVSGNFAQFEEQ